VRFDASEPAIFGPIDIFVKRCKKLIDLFTTIHQFSVLAQVCLGVGISLVCFTSAIAGELPPVPSAETLAIF